MSTTASSSLPSEAVDELYYSPSGSDRVDGVGTSFTDMEVAVAAAAQKYGGSAKNGAGINGAGAPGAKITLTRWLSAKVQDYPEV